MNAAFPSVLALRRSELSERHNWFAADPLHFKEDIGVSIVEKAFGGEPSIYPIGPSVRALRGVIADRTG